MAEPIETRVGENVTQNPKLSGPLLVDKIKPGCYGQSLTLKELDILVGVASQPYGELGPLEDEIEYHLEEFARPVLLSFMREGKLFHVLAERPLGVNMVHLQGESLQSLDGLMRNIEFPYAEGMQNYQIFSDKDKKAELRLHTTSIIAMIAPPFWIMSQRFFEGVVVSVLAILTGFVVHWILGVLTYGLMCLYVGRDQKKLVRSFLGFRGFVQIYTLAAHNEVSAQRAAIDMEEDLQFIFAAKVPRQPRPKPIPSRVIGE